ncbi:hypothetical protein PVAND_004892 [Polypedilum vanderplanki]|uniref:ornithine decarboxylase n=1 Tax=Polypedilum vanderplanki TaxID=319348 RepID=A0A9J6BYI3_POLVA|nr:hypothetical protein PVAND_004892 [Polypedilum vanderplanki]
MSKVFKFLSHFHLEKSIERSLKVVNDSHYICNLSDVIRKYEDWKTHLPRVRPHYAVKCNDNINVLKTLASIGCSFDCASAGEIEKILSLNVNPERIIFANTTKFAKHIEFAEQNQVNIMTFDNEDELYKILKIHPSANLVLRIRYSSDKAIYKLGKKFGSLPNTEAPELLKLAKSLNLNVIGISFHIGSSCEDYEVYCGAIAISRVLFQFAADIGYNFRILDIGGGFPGDNFNRVKEFSCMINNALNQNFPLNEFPNLEILSEPGRYFVESAFTLVTQIHSRKITRDADGKIVDVMYYLNEGVYSNFLFIPLGPEEVIPKILSHKRTNEQFRSTIWGPTCDSTDKICEDIKLELLEIGDVIYFTNMGAYTIPLSTSFNGFPTTKIVYFLEENVVDSNKLNTEMFDFNFINDA